MKKILGLLLFSFLSHIVIAQTPEQDSLNLRLAVTKEDTTKVQIRVRLSWLDGSIERGLQLVQEGLTLAKKLNYKKGEADCLHQLGNQVRARGNYILALHYYVESLKLREQLALLVPIHHRMAKWISHRLVEKNRKIRLNATKRTIAKLETDPSN